MRGVQLIIAEVNLSTNSADPPGVSIDNTASDSNASRKAEIVGRFLAKGTS